MKLKKLIITLCVSVSSQPLYAGQIIEPSMVTIPAGQFEMGGAKAKQQPIHQVAINAFKLSKYEVTVKEFRQFIAATGHATNNECWVWQEVTKDHDWGINIHKGNWQTPKYAPSANHPVMCVTWQDAKSYASWLSEKTGKSYRLPTEAEWEYAARAGSKTDYPFGNDPKQLCEHGNILDQSSAKALARDYKVKYKAIACNDGAEYTSEVGRYQANAFGLYDMIGNVGEYVQDCEHENYQGAPTDGSVWSENCNTDNPMIIHRGGSYSSGEVGSRTATRAHAGTGNASSLGEGFRLAETIILK